MINPPHPTNQASRDDQDMVDLKERIVMLPFMAKGHLIPFLALARKLEESSCASAAFTVTIATTPLNVKYLLSSSTNSSHNPQIEFVPLPFNGADHGLPPNIESTESLPLTKIADLFFSSYSLEAPFRRLMADIVAKDGHPPLCIISDIFMGWANDVARDFGTVNVAFTTGGAYGTAAYFSIWQHLPHRSTGQDEFKVAGFPDSYRFHVSQLHPFLRAADGTDRWSQFFQPQLTKSLNSFGMLCNTVEEIEPFGLDILRKYVNIPVWCVGPLLPSRMLGLELDTPPDSGGREPGLPTEKCIEWLDLQSDYSVLYISFGSQNSISPSQMMALALGLKDSGKPFIWSIRPPIGFDPKGEFRAEWLPEGFAESNNQGLLVHGWAPQLEILSHRSTGAFLSHCGWNSVMESLSQGVPIIGWPLAGEQAYNSKMIMEEMGVCVELTRGAQSVVRKEDVKRVLDIVMDQKREKGEEMKRKTVKIGELIRASVESHTGSSPKSLDNFISSVLLSRNKQH